MDVVQSKMKYLADSNDNIADQTGKTSALLPPQSTDPITGKLKFPLCNSICDVETVDSASLLMNDDAMDDEDDIFDEVEEQPTSVVQELSLIKDFAVQLATIARGSLFPDKVAATCILQVAKAAVTLPTPNNQPRSLALEVETTMPECIVPRTEGEPNLTVQVNCKLLKEYFNTGEAVDHSIMAPCYSRCSHAKMRLQGHRTSAKGKYKILLKFYYSAIQQISDKCL